MLELVSRATFCNPFSEDFCELLGKIAGAGRPVSAPERLKLLAERWNDGLRKLQAAGMTTLKQTSGADRVLLRDAFLFEIYHRFMGALDQLVTAQIAAGDKPVAVPFARKALRLFARRGFSHAEAVRYFALIYQVRRAYYLIDRGLVGVSPCMQEFRRHLWNNVFTHDIRLYDRYLCNQMEDFSTLLLGETGTGKGTAAAAIGRSGFIPFDEKKGCFAESFMAGFVSLNLSEHPETLIESELFGHRKGAFTGAVENHDGIFARCRPCGSIFLDEIGDIAVPIQLKLLRVLQERTFAPVGSHDKLRFRGRVIVATNKPIELLRESGAFRDDFFYRLSSDIITLPTLRQRVQEDSREVDLLLGHILKRVVPGASEDLADDVNRKLVGSVGRDYPWPGNVRELEQAVRRVLVTGHYAGDRRTAAVDDVSRLVTGIREGGFDADAVLSGYCKVLYARHGTYEAVARVANLDRRTVKAYLEK
jgi:DNA-binding NtrC family response regulator